jgi:hypothetical protein
MVKKGGQTTSFLFEFNTFIGQYWLQTHDNYPKDLRFVIGGKTMGNGECCAGSSSFATIHIVCIFIRRREFFCKLPLLPI